MALFKKAVSTSAYLKAGFMGFAGAGKTRTATDVAVGLLLLLRQMGLKEGQRPIYFLDTETGSDYIEHRVREAHVELFTAKTRAFADLLNATDEAEQAGGVLVVDSITHFWREFCETYQRRRNRKFLEFQDWNFLKGEWGRFTDRFINSSCHIIICGRAGFEYDNQKNEDTGKTELVKTGVKMKTENEMGYEPSLLVHMERHEDISTHVVRRAAHVLKDRFDVLDGKALCNEETRGPTFEMFLPHIRLLNLGGAQLGVDTSRTSDELITDDGKTRWAHEKEQKAICLDEIKEEIARMHPGQGAADKKDKADTLEEAFGTRSWTKVESMKLDQLKIGRSRIWNKSRGHGYGVEPQAASDDGGWVAGEQAQQQPANQQQPDVLAMAFGQMGANSGQEAAGK
jgi:hypothetical protein